MKVLEIYLSNKAKRFLKKADKSTFERVFNKITELASDPHPSDAKTVFGRKKKVFRVRIGDYRILYVVYLDKNSVLIVNIDKRSKVYEK